MKQELWLSRAGGDGEYGIHEEEPDWNYYFEEFDGGMSFGCLCPKLFHQAVEGARLRKGRKKRIKRILIELED